MNAATTEHPLPVRGPLGDATFHRWPSGSLTYPLYPPPNCPSRRLDHFPTGEFGLDQNSIDARCGLDYEESAKARKPVPSAATPASPANASNVYSASADAPSPRLKAKKPP
jgi:hypothetical protein